MRSFLVASGVSQIFANAFASGWGDPAQVLASLQDQPERKRIAASMRYLFDDVPLLLRAGGFTGLFWFVDELENVVNSQNANERATWAKELRTQLIAVNTAARQFGFIFPVLVTHTGVTNVLSQGVGTIWPRSVRANAQAT